MAIESVMMNDEIGVLEQLMQRYLGAVDLEAVSYTHLDVYKRQESEG